jgi:hypothetical protein
MIWLLLYIISAAVSASWFIFQACDDEITLNDLWIAFWLGAFCFITIPFVIYTWWDEAGKSVVLFRKSDLFGKKKEN